MQFDLLPLAARALRTHRDSAVGGLRGYSAADDDYREHWSHLMRWLSALSNFELIVFIVSVGVLVAGALLLLEIAGVSVVGGQ